jgi:hypothetical protein
MTWEITSINLSTVPSREGTLSYDTEAAFETALKLKLADPKTQVVSATLDDGTVLNEAELRTRYVPT